LPLASGKLPNLFMKQQAIREEKPRNPFANSPGLDNNIKRSETKISTLAESAGTSS